MKALYDWLKARWWAFQAVTGEASGHRPPPPRGGSVVRLTDTDYLRLLIITRAWL
jgi:hypothetical protein